MPSRVKNIKTFKVGVTAFTTIKEISVSEETAEIADSGDNDIVDTFIAKGKSTCRGQIMVNDGIQATALKATVGSANVLTAEGEDASDTSAQKITITGAQFFNKSSRVLHNDVWTHVVTFRAQSYAIAALP